MKKFRNKKFIIFILILFISIGFAYLSATLNIAGLIGYKGNSWNIYFDNVQMIINDVEGDRPTINNSKDTVNFNISFNEPSEVYRFSVDVVNSGTIDAMIGELIKTGIDSSNSDYIDYSISYSNGSNVEVNDLLSHGSKVRLVVNVEYKNSTERIAPTGTENYSLTVKYVQARDNARKVETILDSGTNNTFVLNNVKANTLSNLKIYGNSAQQQYTGRNLYNVEDYCTNHSSCVTYGADADSDGWITVSRDNTEGTTTVYSNFFTNNLNLVIGNTYTVVVEIKSITGTGGLAYTSRLEQNNITNGQLGYHSFKFSDKNAGDIVVATNNALDSGTWGLRTYGYWAPGESGSITFRLSVIEGTSVTAENFVYEPYVGGMPSPNPNYPQEVHNVNNNVSIKMYDNISYFPYECKYYTSSGISVYGLNYEISNGYSSIISGQPITDEYRIGNRYNSTDSLFSVEPNTTYYYESNLNLESQITIVDDTNDTYRLVNVHSGSSFTTTSTETGISSIRIYVNKNIVYDNTLLTYLIYKNKNDHQLSLNDIQLNKIDDYRDYIYNKDGEWYINRIIKKRNINQYVNAIEENGNSNKDVFSYSGAFHITVTDYTELLPGSMLSNKFVNLCDSNLTYNAMANVMQNVTFCIRQGSKPDRIYFRYIPYSGLTGDEIKSRLLPLDLYYVMNTSVDEKITNTTLINQLNNLINNNIFDGTNYITVTGSDLTPNIEFDYDTN